VSAIFYTPQAVRDEVMRTAVCGLADYLLAEEAKPRGARDAARLAAQRDRSELWGRWADEAYELELAGNPRRARYVLEMAEKLLGGAP
jgi:hypothetical protein